METDINKDTYKGKGYFVSPLFRQDGFRITLIALAYFAAHQIAFLFPDADKVLAAIWPAGGIGLAALLLSRRRLWPAILVALFVSGNTANLLEGRPLFNSLGFMTANCLESLACAWLITRWCGNSITFFHIKEIFALFCAAVLVNAATALIGAGTALIGADFAAIANRSSFLDFWTTWWVGDGLGILIIGSFIVTWSSLRFTPNRFRWPNALEWGVFFALWITAAWWCFLPQIAGNLLSFQPYMLVLLLTWAAIRLGPRGITLALSLVTIISVTSLGVSQGPMVWGGATPSDRLLLVQIFLTSIAVVELLLAASYSETKAAEKSSWDNHERIRTLGDNLPNGMIYQVVHNLDGRMQFQYVSAGVEKLNGITAKEILRDSAAFYSLILLEDLPLVESARAISIENRRPFSVMVRMRKPDGQIRWMDLISSPRFLPDGRLIWDGIQIDITERKLAEDRIKRSEELLNEAQRISKISSWEYNLISSELYLSKEGYSIYELAEDIPNNQLFDAFKRRLLPEDVILLDTTSKNAVQNGLGYTYDVRALFEDGRIKNITGVGEPVRDITGKLISYRGVFQDISEHKKAEEALRESESKLKKAQHYAHIGSWSWNIKTNQLDWSDEMFNIFGLKKETFTGSLESVIASAIHPDDRSKVDQSNLSVSQDKKPIPLEYRVVWPDGSVHVVWAEAGEFQFDAAGNPELLSGTVQDITERKQAEEGLRKSEIKYRNLVEGMPGIVYSFSNKQGGIYYSSNVTNLLGYSPEQLIAQPLLWNNAIDPDDRTRVQQVIQESVVGKPFHIEYRISDAHGRWHWFDDRSLGYKKEDSEIIIEGLALDITERREAEEELRKSQALYLALVEYQIDPICRWLPDTTLTFVNSAYCDYFGENREEFLGTRFKPRLPQETQDKIQDAIDSLQSRKVSTISKEEFNFDAQGNKRWLVWAYRPIFDNNDQIVEFQSVGRDITELKLLTEKMIQSQKLADLGTLAAGVAHEVNTPLQIITGSSENLLAKLEKGDTNIAGFQSRLERIKQGAWHIAEIVRALLIYARNSNDQVSPVNLNDLVRDALLLTEHQMHVWSNIAFVTNLAENLPEFLCDRNKITQVLINLLNNARDAMPDGGTLTISTGVDAQAQKIILTVSDTGEGIPQDLRQRIFDPFFTTKPLGHGTGLGLSIVMGIVRSHGGEIIVESEPGQGSTFIISFKLTPTSKEQDTPKRSRFDKL